MTLPLPRTDPPATPVVGSDVPRALVLALVLLAGAVLLGLGSGVWPRATAALVVGSLLVAGMLVRLDWAALVVVTTAPLVAHPGYIDPRIAAGLVVVLAGSWLVHRSRGLAFEGPGLSRLLLFPLLLALVVIGGLVVQDNGAAGSESTLAWLVVITATAVLVDAMRSAVAPITLVRGYVTGACAASVIGLISFWSVPLQRLLPPEDLLLDLFTFHLLVAAPLAIALRYAATRRRWWCDVALVVLLAGMMPGASWVMLLGLVLMLVTAAVTRMISARATVAIGVLLGSMVLAVSAVFPTLGLDAEERAVRNQQSVAVRWEAAEVAASMTAAHPVVGLGPGAFELYQQDFRESSTATVAPPLDKAHTTYLGTSAELGLLGLSLLLATLLGSLRGAWRRRVADRTPIAAGTVLALVGALGAAITVSVQQSLGLWLLVAFGMAVSRVPEEQPLPASLVRLRRDPEPPSGSRQP